MWWPCTHHRSSYCSVTQSCPTLCNPMDCSTPGFPVLHYLLEFAQTHIHWVSDAIQPSHPLSPPSPPAFNLSQHHGLFQWDGSSHWVTKVLELQLQHQSSIGYSGLISFKIDCFDLLEAQGTLKSLLQHHSRSLFSRWSESEVILSGTSLSSSYWSWRRLLVLTGLALSKPPTV